MKNLNFSSLTFLPANLRLIIKSGALLVLVIAMGGVLLRYGVSLILKQRQEIAIIKKEEVVMKDKIETLKVIEPNLDIFTHTALIAVPSENPGLVVASQIKSLASEKNVLVTQFKLDKNLEENQVLSSELNLKVTGSLSPLVEFLQNLNGISPIITLTHIEIDKSAGEASADISLRVYWSKLPTQIPALSGQLESLTETEKKTLDRILRLREPSVFEGGSSQVSSGRTNPFE